MSLSPNFQPFRPQHLAQCMTLFDANSPQFFAPNERDDYYQFLTQEPEGYCVWEEANNVIAAYGLIEKDAGVASINWIMILPCEQGRGFGHAIMQAALHEAKSKKIRVINIAASHVSAPFFKRYGATKERYIENGWGPNMHRVDMKIELPNDTSNL